MGEGCLDEQPFPVDRYPDPVCRYAVVGDEPVVRGVNDAFESAFGRVDQNTPVTEALESLGLTARGVDSVADALKAGGRFTVSASANGHRQRFPVRVVPPADGEEGVAVFTDTEGDDIAVDHVASAISHDLRNPLDVAKARLRAGQELDEDDHFDRVAQAHDRMERIIQDVLTLARGDDVVEPSEPVELGAVAEHAWETVDTNGATLSVGEDLPTAVADPDRVTRLFENLFRNSVEHGPDAVTVTVGRLEDGFFVADDGPGIPADERERVFDPGYSGDDHGTGLGLAIVARVADCHGWSVTATDGDAGGARFEFRGVDPAA